ncbi:DUF4827 domain-containing protein [Bacteroides pyogenes]|uniref:DUF4827 domain-containing protein n=1 Tax=Bacteroides pyogenes TaxID=310300 RepID=UPI002FDA7186
MKKLIFILISLWVAGSLFQSCDNTKTYAEMLEEERDAVKKFIKDSAIHVISLEEFEKDTITASKEAGDDFDEFVAFSNGVYLQIINRGDKTTKERFRDGEEICARYLEKNVATRETACFNIFQPDWADANQTYTQPAVFRYVDNGVSSAYGIFTEMDYMWSKYYGSSAVPAGWLLSLPYLWDNARIRLIIPSKMGHSSAQRYVTSYYYYIQGFSKAES